jgi:hypothetical protein
MALRPPHWFAIVGTALFSFAATSDNRPSARAGDPPQGAHESAVLDRIFANWKARHDRIHSLHFTWDCRKTHKKGWPDPSGTPGNRLAKDQVFEQFGVQLWIEGDDRLCLIRTPLFLRCRKRS